MKKRLTILTLFITLCSCAFAQTPDWGDFNSAEGNGFMGTTVIASITIDGELQANTFLEIAPFSNGVRCGEPQKLMNVPNTNNYVALMVVKGGSYIQFKLYDYRSHSMYQNLSVEGFQNVDNSIYGDAYDPFELNFYSVAKVGDLKYGTLQDAYNAVEEDGVITLTNSTTGPGLVIDKDVTIDFNGKTYTFNEGVGNIPSNGFQILQGNNVTLKNGGLAVNADDASEFYILVQNYANLTVDGMNLDGTNLDKWSTVETDQDSYVLSNNSGNVVIKNSKIKANDQGSKAFAFDVCKYASYEAPVVTLDAASEINGIVELNGGQLFTDNARLKVVAKKEFIGGQSYWSTISSPIADATIPTDVQHDLYRYDEEHQQWEYYTGEGASNPYTELELGRGYLYVAGSNNVTVELNGTLNVNDVEFPLSYTGGNALAGFNMVGNPFSYNITDANWSAGNATLSSGFYVISENGGWIAKTAGSTIAPMESVLVKTNAAATLNINKGTTTDNGSSKRGAVNNGVIAISASNDNYSDVAYVSFNEGIGLDKINHRNANVPMVYVPVEGVNYAIAMMNQDVTEIPVSFVAKTMGEYTISVEAQDCEYAMMTLVDRLTGVETNLLIEDYTFIAKTNDNPNRFIIKLAKTNNNGGSVENFAFINNGMMYIYNIEGQGVVSIYDITGRPVAEYNVATSANIATSDFAAGVYVIRMSDENGIKVQKIVIE